MNSSCTMRNPLCSTRGPWAFSAVAYKPAIYNPPHPRHVTTPLPCPARSGFSADGEGEVSCYDLGFVWGLGLPLSLPVKLHFLEAENT